MLAGSGQICSGNLLTGTGEVCRLAGQVPHQRAGVCELRRGLGTLLGKSRTQCILDRLNEENPWMCGCGSYWRALLGTGVFGVHRLGAGVVCCLGFQHLSIRWIEMGWVLRGLWTTNRVELCVMTDWVGFWRFMACPFTLYCEVFEPQ